MAWRKFHRDSGATGFENRLRLTGCNLVVVPEDWTNPKGPARYTASCAGFHKRGNAKTLRAAKSAALKAARRLRKRERGY